MRNPLAARASMLVQVRLTIPAHTCARRDDLHDRARAILILRHLSIASISEGQMPSPSLYTPPEPTLSLQSSPVRPFGVTLLAIAYWMLAFLVLAIGIVGNLDRLRVQNVTISDVMVGGFFLILSLLSAWIGFGLWCLRRKTYWLVLVLCGVTIISQLVTLVQAGTLRWPGLFVYVGIMLYLLRSKVRAAFQ